MASVLFTGCDRGYDRINLIFVLDGNLEKLKTKFSLLGSWNTRYFRINPMSESLDYFATKSEAHGSPSRSFNLENLKSIKKFEENTFQLDFGLDGVCTLRADSLVQYTCWFEGLEKYIKERAVSVITSLCSKSVILHRHLNDGKKSVRSLKENQI